ncbi:MAG: hypothetical protein ABJJ53_10685 [Sulfitobacter sp.]
MKQNDTDGAVAPKSVAIRQLIISVTALGIMGLGCWSLMGQNAPYHPDLVEGDVSKDIVPDLHSVVVN